MRNIFLLRQGIDDPKEAHCRKFEEAIATTELEKCNATTHIELNKDYADGDDEDVTKWLQAICLIISADLDQYSGIWNNLKNSTLIGTDNYPKTTTAAYNILCRYNKTAPPHQVHTPPTAVTFIQSDDREKIRQHQEIMGDPFQKLHTIYDRRR